MEDRLNRIEEKIDRIIEKQAEQAATLVVNTKVLEVHEQRSTTNENNLDLLRKEFKPVKEHVQFMNNLAKIVAAVGATVLVLDKLGVDLVKLLTLTF